MVYMILGTGFEPMEAIAPCDILRRGGVEVQLAGIGGTMIEAGHGITVKADCTVEEADFANAEMVVLPGGLGGVRSILGCKAAMDAVQKAYDDGKHVAAICAGPTILATLHITDGKTAHVLSRLRGADGKRKVCAAGCGARRESDYRQSRGRGARFRSGAFERAPGRRGGKGNRRCDCLSQITKGGTYVRPRRKKRQSAGGRTV